jgi:hypothetical protein
MMVVKGDETTMNCSESILENLRDAGCDETLVQQYCEIANQPIPEEAASGRQAQLLRGYRRELLERLHDDQRKIDCLDHLLYLLRVNCQRG